MTRGAVLVAQGALVMVGVAAFVMREQLGAMTWLFALVPLAGILVSMFWLAGQAAEEEAGEALLLAEEAIRQEARRLDSRRAEIGKVLMAYGEWMEFPDFEEIQKVEWATTERSAQDAEVAALMERQADRVLERVSEGYYWEEGQLQTRALLLDFGEFVESIAGIYNPESERAILETNLGELLKSVNRVSLQVILLLEEIPLLDLKDWNLRQVTDKIRTASKVAKKYEDLQPILNPVRYLWQGSKFLLASNPLLAAGWIAGSNLIWKGGKKIGKRSLDGYLLSLVRQVLGIIAWETASIYDRTSRFRDPEWVYGVELAHLVSEFPLERESLRAALRELGALSLRSSYDRIFLYRCVAQHVSPKPERFIQADLMTEDTRKEIVESLTEFFREYVGDTREKKVAKWRKDLAKRLEVQVMPMED
ncbi:MAG TPA: hypothetical protein DCS85_03055 [Verrucomicrobiales bacterium]|nr:hypothetical protein [Verrucomicrobiales bacterium]